MRSLLSIAWAVARQRCPRCRRGPVFHGLMSMYDTCHTCGLRFEREPGYFLGAMYASYFFGLVTTAYWFPMLLLGIDPWIVVGVPTLHLIAQIPISFRYSRVIWLHVDHGFDPEITSWKTPTAD
jgi:uncharacterized protein (DUF983 family)